MSRILGNQDVPNWVVILVMTLEVVKEVVTRLFPAGLPPLGN